MCGKSQMSSLTGKRRKRMHTAFFSSEQMAAFVQQIVSAEPKRHCAAPHPVRSVTLRGQTGQPRKYKCVANHRTLGLEIKLT